VPEFDARSSRGCSNAGPRSSANRVRRLLFLRRCGHESSGRFITRAPGAILPAVFDRLGRVGRPCEVDMRPAATRPVHSGYPPLSLASWAYKRPGALFPIHGIMGMDRRSIMPDPLTATVARQRTVSGSDGRMRTVTTRGSRSETRHLHQGDRQEICRMKIGVVRKDLPIRFTSRRRCGYGRRPGAARPRAQVEGSIHSLALIGVRSGRRSRSRAQYHGMKKSALPAHRGVYPISLADRLGSLR